MTLHAASRRQRALRHKYSRFPLTLHLFLALCFASASVVSTPAQTPAMGSEAPDFALSTPAGKPIRLSQYTAPGMTVLVVLRGFPGYQCPYCEKQAHDFIEHTSAFAAKKVNILLVYPGPPAELDQRAKEFLAKQADLPPNIKLVIDPDYTMTKLYGLRWNAPQETAYPATFLLDRHRKILFEKISHSHGDRTTAQEVLAQIVSQ